VPVDDGEVPVGQFHAVRPGGEVHGQRRLGEVDRAVAEACLDGSIGGHGVVGRIESFGREVAASHGHEQGAVEGGEAEKADVQGRHASDSSGSQL
jgi:hypothetical protein